MQKTKTAKKEQENLSYREMPVYEDRRIDSVKRNFAIGIDRVGSSVAVGSGPARMRKGITRN